MSIFPTFRNPFLSSRSVPRILHDMTLLFYFMVKKNRKKAAFLKRVPPGHGIWNIGQISRHLKHTLDGTARLFHERFWQDNFESAA